MTANGETKGMSEEAIKDSLRVWIARKNGKISVDELSDTLPLVDQRILSSLHVAELLLFIGQLRGQPVEIESLGPGMFRDVDTIYRTFFHSRPDGS